MPYDHKSIVIISTLSCTPSHVLLYPKPHEVYNSLSAFKPMSCGHHSTRTHSRLRIIAEQRLMAVSNGYRTKTISEPNTARLF